jgi:FixJ family two-component response regulator
MPSAKTQTYKIYIVDDDDSVRRALTRLIHSERLDFESFASVEGFLAALPASAQGCAVMDIRMAGLSGHDVQQELKDRGHTIQVIALSAEHNEDCYRRARELGAVAFFRKPVDDQALLDAIQWARQG